MVLLLLPLVVPQLNLNWTANTDSDLNHYNIYRGTTNGFPVTLGVTPPTATTTNPPTANSYQDTGLTPSTTYYYKVSAVDNAGNIGLYSSPDQSATTAAASDTTPPAQVNGLAVTTSSGTQLNLNWTANTDSDLNHYNIYRGTTNGFPVTLGVTPPTATTTNPPTANSYQDTGLTPSTTYYYKVSAVDNAGNIGLYSSPDQSATTAASVNPVFYNVTIPGDGYATLNSGGSVRYGEEANTATSLLIGKSLKTWKVRLRKRGTPSGNVTANVRRRSDDAIVATFNETINSTTLGTSFAEYTFTLTTPYTIAAGDRIMIEYAGPAGVDMEVWLTDQFNGANTRRVRYTTTYAFSDTADVTGSMSSN